MIQASEGFLHEWMFRVAAHPFLNRIIRQRHTPSLGIVDLELPKLHRPLHGQGLVATHTPMSNVTYRSQPKQPNGGARALSSGCRLGFYGLATGPVQHCHDSLLLPEFMTELGTSCGAAFLALLAATPPLPFEVVCKEDGERSTEVSEVDKHFRPTRAAWDQVRHVCRGSESVAPMLVKQLCKQGFVVEAECAVDDL